MGIVIDRAMAIWPVLVKRARRKGDPRITYGELARAIGLRGPRLSRQLEPIYRYCRSKSREGWPQLTAIVVSPGTGLPYRNAFGAEEFANREGFEAEFRRVQAFDWSGLAPTRDQLTKLMGLRG